MAIKERIENTLEKNRVFIDTDPRKLGAFVEELRNSGLVVKKEYDLPPLDTIGRRIYRDKNRFSC